MNKTESKFYKKIRNRSTHDSESIENLQTMNNRFMNIDDFRKTLEFKHFKKNVNLAKKYCVSQDFNTHFLKTTKNNTKSSFKNSFGSTGTFSPQKTMYKTSLNNLIYLNDDNKKNYTEEELNELLKFYHTSANYNKEVPNKIKKLELFKKFGIKKKIENHNTNNNTLRDLKLTKSSFNFYTKFEQTKVYDDEYFKNPISSIKKLNVNRQIYEKFMDCNNKKIKDTYMEIYNKAVENQMKIECMPEIKCTFSGLKSNIDLIEGLSYNQTKFINSFKNQINTNTNDPLKNISRHSIFTPVIDVSGKYITQLNNKPSSRAQMSFLLSESNVYIFGGVNGRKLNDVWVLSIDGDNFKWKFPKSYGEPPLQRYGHSACMYRHEIFIFGGVIDENPFCPREDILIVDTLNNKFIYESTQNKSLAEWRRNHVAEAVGAFMLIHGGINDEGEYLSSISVLDMYSLKWHTPKINNDPYEEFGIAHHSCCLVMPISKRTHSSFHIYKQPDIPLNITTKLIHEGIYFFGGCDEERRVTNKLCVLKINRKVLEWCEPKTLGKPPSPRMNTSMNYYEEMNCLIIFGGKNPENKSSEYLDDFFVLDLETLNWSKMVPFDVEIKPRAEHGSVICQNKLIIFGGMNDYNYHSADLLVIKLEFLEGKHLKEQYRLQRGGNLNKDSKKPSVAPSKDNSSSIDLLNSDKLKIKPKLSFLKNYMRDGTFESRK